VRGRRSDRFRLSESSASSRPGMRPLSTRARPRTRSGDRRLDKPEEGQYVSLSISPFPAPTDVSCLRSPREAAFEVVRFVNHRTQNTSMLALTVRLLNCCLIRSVLYLNMVLLAPRYPRQELRLPVSPPNCYKRLSQRARAAVPGEAAGIFASAHG
jgi:hypothetical protein